MRVRTVVLILGYSFRAVNDRMNNPRWDEMGKAYRTHRKDEKCVQNLK